MIGQTAINIVVAVDSKFVLLVTILGEYTGYLIVAKHGSRPGFQQKDLVIRSSRDIYYTSSITYRLELITSLSWAQSIFMPANINSVVL